MSLAILGERQSCADRWRLRRLLDWLRRRRFGLGGFVDRGHCRVGACVRRGSRGGRRRLGDCRIDSVSAGKVTAEKEASSPASSVFILTSSPTSAFCTGSTKDDFAGRVSSSDSSLSIRRECFLTLRIFKAAKPLGVEDAGLFFGRLAWFPLAGGGTAGVLLLRVSSLDSRAGDKARDAARDDSCDTGSDSDSDDE